METLFTNDDSDTEVNFKTNNEYAKNYNNWRQKEELNKLKTKYGEDFDPATANGGNSSSSSEDEDDDDMELDEKLETDFLKTLSSLKNKDPRIYNENVKFFDDKPIDTSVKKKKNKDQPMFIKDYERKMLLEKGGQLSDSEGEEYEDNPRARSPTYVEEQQQLKNSLKDALNGEDDEDENWGGLFKTRAKSNEEKEKEDRDYKQWLLGQKQQMKDENMETELKPLKDYWNDPKLDSSEKFLRDYILNNRFLEKDDKNYVPTYEEVVHDSDAGLSEDEDQIEKQEEFEVKYNYRFEEPDQDFIKKYPRTMENSVRKTDDRRKIKRAEVKERKQKEKEQKMEDIKQLQSLKKQEIIEKLQKLKEITGNTEIAFDNTDFDDDFDPDAHDKRMEALFNEEFYEGEEGDQKPEFPDLDEELEIERWDKYDKDKDNAEDKSSGGNVGPHCEDDDFNMDCDYDSKSLQQELIENSKGKKKRNRKSKFAVAVSESKPVFDPNDKTYEEYFDEYYKLDCEDIIGDVPCRFKYRKVTPNTFGLTVDEILKANDRELNRWCSLKKALQYRPEHMEKYDQIAYTKKAQNEALKRKLLPSLYLEEKEDETTNPPEPKKKRNRRKKNGKAAETITSEGAKKLNEVETKIQQTIVNETSEVTGTEFEKQVETENNNLSENIAANEIVKENNTNKVVKKGKKNRKKNNANNDKLTQVSTQVSEQSNSKPSNKSVKNNSINTETDAVVNGKQDPVITQASEICNSKATHKSVKKIIKNKKANTEKDSVNGKAAPLSTEVSETPNSKATTKLLKKNAKNKKESVANDKPVSGKTQASETPNSKATNKSVKKNAKHKKENNEKDSVVAELGKKRKHKGAENKNAKRFKKQDNSKDIGLSDARLKAFGIRPKKFKNKLKYSKATK